MKRIAHCSIGLLFLAATGCGGRVDADPQGPRTDLGGDGRPVSPGVDPARAPDGDDGPRRPGDVDQGPPPGTEKDGCGVPYAPPRAVLLTPRQYVNLLLDVVGPDAVSDEDAALDDKLEFDTVDLPRVTAATVDHAVRLSGRAVESLRGKAASFLGCTRASDRACVRANLEGVAKRAYKRALRSGELDELMKLYDEGAELVSDGGETGVLTAVQGILLAPSTLYRTEFEQAASARVRELSSHERAAAIALMLLDSAPDEKLLEAADKGELSDVKAVEREVDRLLALPRVQAHLTRLVLNAFKVSKLFETPKDARAFPQYTPALQRSMYEETRRFVERIIADGAPLGELLTSRTSFVDRGLAQVYGVPFSGSGSNFVEVELPPERSGLLTQASVLSVLSRTEKTSVVARGLFVRGALLCLPKVASPPASLQAQIEEQLEDDATERELAAYRADTSPCKGCHAGFDAFGLLLEEFDAIGRYSGKEAAPTDFQGLGGFDSLTLPAELAREKADDGQFTACMTRRTLGYALSVASEPIKPGCEEDPLTTEVVAKGGSMRDLVVAIATSPHFARRAEQEP